jgi:hypothetical protein
MAELEQKKVKYTSRDFGSLRDDLITFAESYFPAVYRDFNEASPGMMFMEMSAYVGDVLSFYTDNQFKESLLLEAEEKSNILAIAQSMGYQPKFSSPATVTLDFYQIVPAIGSGENNKPDMRYAMTLDANAVVASSIGSNINFITNDFVDFSFSSSLSPLEVRVYEINETTNEPTFYLLKKSVPASSGTIRTQRFAFGSAIPYNAVKISDAKVIEVIDATDSEGDTWYHVPYLAQDTIVESVRNIKRNDKDLYMFRESAPYLLKLRKVSKRFTSRVLSDDSILLQFGPGISGFNDEQITPDPSLFGTIFSPYSNTLQENIDPSNFLFTRNYGIAPANTELIVRYRVGGGIADNVPANSLTNILSKRITMNESGLDPTLASLVKQSLFVTNTQSASGGKDAETLNEIKTNTLAFFAAQSRAVTKEDYIARAYTMPPRFGSIGKAYVVQDDQLNIEGNSDNLVFLNPNPNALNFYVLGYNENGNLTTTNTAVKENLKTYLSSFRMLTDAINVKDAYIINFGIDFEVTPRPEYSGYETIANCISVLADYFDIRKWQINQPIVVSEIYNILDRVPGVQTVVDVKFVNLYDTTQGYSPNVYDMQYAEQNGLIYPSLDPSIFELKFPYKDIRGRIR